MFKVSTKCVLVLAICVMTLFSGIETRGSSIGQCEASVELLGEYHGVRMDKHFSQSAKNYRIQTVKHFDLIQEGRIAEAAELMNKVIKPLLKEIEQLPRCRFNFHTYGRGVLRMLFTIDTILPAEMKEGGAYANQAWIDLSLEEFVQLFAGPQMGQIVLEHHHNLYKKIVATTVVEGDKRLITIRMQDFSDANLTKVTHDDELNIEINAGSLDSVQVFRSKKHLFKLKRYMWAKMDFVKKVARGLEVGKAGRLVTRSFIERALKENNEQNFSSLVKEEAALHLD